ncbi:MAG: PAS domain-containing protein [Propionibacteriaceae bacterium]|nr:PAS domain-containing protein [Propionibacteriaceae bacterium]
MDERQTILRCLARLVEPLAATMPGECEVVLHDLDQLPNSIIAIAGGLTGRQVGGPATDRLLRDHAQGVYSTRLGYAGRGPDGQALRSSTVIVRDSADRPVAALCLNNDTRSWRLAAELARSMLPWTETGEPAAETMLPDVDALAHQVLRQAVEAAAVPVELMRKRHKLAVVRDLKERGFFTLRESVETAAQALGVTRFTVYNYLNQLETDQLEAGAPETGASPE